MTKEQKYFLRILSDHIKKCNTTEESDIDWKIVFDIAKSHELHPIISFQCKAIVSDYSSFYARQVSRFVNLKNEISSLEELLADVPYALEKGAVVSGFYPVPALRTMGDMDILVPTENRKEVFNLLAENGYSCESAEDEDEWKFIKKDMLLEVHSRPMHHNLGNEKLAEYFSDWKKFLEGHRLEINYHVLFLFIHLRQHLLASGVGFRPFVDIAVMTKNADLDWNWIITEAEKLGADEFIKVVLALNERWFQIKSPFETSIEESFFETATEDIFRNGIFGRSNSDNSTNAVARLVSNKKVNVRNAKVQFYFSVLFPKYSRMIQYSDCPTYLKGRKYLLPVAWIERIFKKVSNKKTREAVIRTSTSANERVKYFKMWGC